MALTTLYVNKIIADDNPFDVLTPEERRAFIERYKDMPVQKIEPKEILSEYQKYSEEIKLKK